MICKKGDEFVSNFDIIKLKEEEMKLLIIMKANDSPFEYMDEIKERLIMLHYSGILVIDSLLHSGNTEERFIKGFFDGLAFEHTKFSFENVPKKSVLRKYMCEYLRSEEELLRYSGLSSQQQNLILKGFVI